MKTLSTIFAASALAFAFAAPVPSYAQGAFPDSIYAPGHEWSAKGMIGAPVYNGQHEKIGTVENVLVKPAASEPMVVLSVGDYIGTGPKMVEVPLSHLTAGGKTSMTMADATKAMLQSLPGYSVLGG